MIAPHHDERASVDELPRYLEEARALFAARSCAPDSSASALSGMPAEMESLRWFLLPSVCLEA